VIRKFQFSNLIKVVAWTNIHIYIYIYIHIHTHIYIGLFKIGSSRILEERIPERSERRESKYAVCKTLSPQHIPFLYGFCVPVLQIQTARRLCFCVIPHVLPSCGRNQTYKCVPFFFLTPMINAINLSSNCTHIWPPTNYKPVHCTCVYRDCSYYRQSPLYL